MHIPKTSGLALSRGQEIVLSPTRSCKPFWTEYSLASSKRFETIIGRERKLIFLRVSDLPESADYITGHVSFSSFRQRYPTAQYVTFCREPICRIVSFWLFWRGWSDEQLRDWGEFGELVALARNPLEHFLAQKRLAVQFDNLYVRMLLWPHPLLPEDDLIDPRNDAMLLRDATKLLSRFSYTDLVENPALARNLEAWLERPFEYARVNETSFRRKGRNSVASRIDLRGVFCSRKLHSAGSASLGIGRKATYRQSAGAGLAPADPGAKIWRGMRSLRRGGRRECCQE
jgi:hypothetical protein